MLTVYAVALGLGFLTLVAVILASAFVTNVRRDDRDPNRRLGVKGRMLIGATLGFGMGGVAAEFSPLDISWPLALVIAILAGALAVIWVGYSDSRVDP